MADALDPLRVAMLGLGLSVGTPAAAQTGPQPAPDVWFGCPSGQAMEAAPDPRIAPASNGAAGPAQRLVVRCVVRSVPTPPHCPPGMRAAPARGVDACVPGGRATTSDGTSNTILVGEPAGGSATPTDGTSNTVTLGESGAAPPAMGDGSVRAVGTGSKTNGRQITTAPVVPQPGCIAPARLLVDVGGNADTCVSLTAAAPGDRVSMPAPR